MTARYAIYYTPAENSALETFGRSWLGRSSFTENPVPRLKIEGISDERLFEITAFPRHYGFHGTLKPPFRLIKSMTANDLITAVKGFAAKCNPVAIAGLKLKHMAGFIALVPAKRTPGLNMLAAACVREFDKFRAPLNPEEMNRRKSAGITLSQEQNLQAWGYPYVFSDFRFHLTLTGRIENFAERTSLLNILEPLTEMFVAEIFLVNGLAVFFQKDESLPFQMLEICAFKGH